MKRIKHFNLSDHTNKLYTKEAISSISLTRDIADKINELVDAYNHINDTDLVWKHEIEGKVEKGVLFMKDNLINSIHDLFEVLEGSDTFVHLYGEKLGEIADLLSKISTYYTPEMFGAAGDGFTDDTDAILRMITYIEESVPIRHFTNEDPCKDYSGITFDFSGLYKISKPIVFTDTYGLTLKNLSLIASPSFNGDGMLILNHITRNFKGSDLTINGCHAAPTCLAIYDYTLTVDLSNIEITQFKEYGIYATGKGHELKITNGRINQFEWGEREKMDITLTGTGLYLGADRHDNNFVNLIINYCTKVGIDLKGGAATFVNCHFYSCEILNTGRYNTFSNCYFDNAAFRTGGFFNMNNCLLLKSGLDDSPFIYLIAERSDLAWMFDTCNLVNNTFKSETYVVDAINKGYLETEPRFNTIGNTFYYVAPFTYHGRLGHTRNPWDEERDSYHNGTEGYYIYGNLAIVWGEATENSFCYFPNGLLLKEVLHISFERKDNSNPNLIPWANTIKEDRFWINSVGDGSTVKWVAIGIVK